MFSVMYVCMYEVVDVGSPDYHNSLDFISSPLSVYRYKLHVYLCENVNIHL